MPKPQRSILGLLLCAGLVNFLDRSSLSIANNSIRAELHFSGTQMGLLLSAFSLSYGLAQLPIGPMLDWLGAQRLLRSGVAVWSCAQIMTAATRGMGSFLPLRVLLGAGEAAFFPASVKIVREQFVPEQRGRAMAAVNMSTIVGQALAPPLLTVLMLACGWRSMFGLLGVAGLGLSLVWYRMGRRSQAYSSNALPAPGKFSMRAWAALFRSPSVWGLMLGFGGINYSVWFYIAWLPAYLESGRSLSVSSSGWLAAVPFLAGAAGMYLSGMLADRADRKGHSMTVVHRRHIVVGMLASAMATAAVSGVRTPGAAIACISAALFFIHFAGTSGWGLLQAAAPPELLATLSSIQNAGSYVFASVSSTLTGWLLDRTHSFDLAFILCACGAAIGALSYISLVRFPLLRAAEATPSPKGTRF